MFVAYAVFFFLVYLLLLLLFKSEYKHTGKSYRSFYHYWTLSDKAKLQIIEMNLSILNKWIRMGLFSPFQYRSLEESRSQQYLSESTSRHFSFDTLPGCHRLKLVQVQSTPLKSNGSAIQRPISFPFADGWVADFFWTETYPNICSYLVKSGQIYQ